MTPSLHRAFVDHALPIFRADPRILGLVAAGSWITGTMDDLSDVDLVAIVERSSLAAVMAERAEIVGRLGPLLAAFTGEHVGEPRLIIALYGPPLLHVDIKFISLVDLATRIEDPVVLWDRDGALHRQMADTTARWPQPDLQWIEDRFWVWVHYGAVKLARGELFEALDHLAFLRGRVLGPLGAFANGRPARGVRFVERDLPELAAELRATVAGYDSDSIRTALLASIALYRRLRATTATAVLVRRSAAEEEAVAFLGSA